MQRAGFRYVFLGIENVLDGDLEFLKARAQERAPRGRPNRRQREHRGDSSTCTRTACSWSAA